MEIVLIVICGLIGAAAGSFLNVCADRLPAEKSIIYPSSHCDGCGRGLSAWELAPVFSYLALRGRCRTCGVKIPLRVLWVELGCGLWTAFLFWYKGLSPEFVFMALYSYVFILIAIIDLQHKLILNKVVFPCVIAGIIIAPFFVHGGNFYQGGVHFGDVSAGLLNGLIGGAVGFAFLLIPALVTRGGMGFGDVKMAFLIGVATGFGEVLVAILGGIILGGMTAVFLLVSRLKKRKEAIPFGPFLSLAAIITLVWGSGIMGWYLGIFGG